MGALIEIVREMSGQGEIYAYIDTALVRLNTLFRIKT